MDKRCYILSHLKKQVIALRSQLQNITKHKYNKQQQSNRINNKSPSNSSRFQSVSFDGSDFDNKGIKKFQRVPFKNISQIIQEKSTPQKIPKLSIGRKYQNQITKENFSTEKSQKYKSRSISPNPITGDGYQYRKSGKKTGYKQRQHSSERKNQRRHFSIYY